MASIARSCFQMEFNSPRISRMNAEKLKRFQRLKAPNGFSVAYGMLLKVLSNDFLSLDEIYEKYNNYLNRFSSRYYIVPEFGPYCSLEKKLSIFREYDYVAVQDVQGISKYKLTPTGENLLETYLLDKDLIELLD